MKLFFKKKAKDRNISFEQMIFEFLISKGEIDFQIGGELKGFKIYPEDYYFVDQNKIDGKWEYGMINRNEKNVRKSFLSKEEALLYFILDDYVRGVNIKLKKRIFDGIHDISNDERSNFVNEIVIREKLDIKNLKIADDNGLIYIEKYIVKNENDFEINRLFLLYLCKLKAIEIVRQELLDFGFDYEILEKYFRFEKLDKVERIISV